MDKSPLDKLRFHGRPQGCESDSEAACPSGAYVSNEEAALIQTLLQLRKDADSIRRELPTAAAEDRAELQHRLDDLRSEWKKLAARRSRAGTRKMAMLGHLPWNEAEWEE